MKNLEKLDLRFGLGVDDLEGLSMDELRSLKYELKIINFNSKLLLNKIKLLMKN